MSTSPRHVGLKDVADEGPGKFSLGMSQRLGIAAAILGDPDILLLDEPVNGLDPEGIVWIREFIKKFASEGRIVFVSSHLLSEMAMTATDLVVIGRGRLITQKHDRRIRGSGASGSNVRVKSPHILEFTERSDSTALVVSPLRRRREVGSAAARSIARIGVIAAGNGICALPRTHTASGHHWKKRLSKSPAARCEYSAGNQTQT